MKYQVEVIFPINDDWLAKDKTARQIADKHEATFFGSGAGFGERDISWDMESQEKAEALAEDLRLAGFTRVDVFPSFDDDELLRSFDEEEE